MALNDDVRFTWVGHGTWRIRSARGKEILIDPWVMSNPVAPERMRGVERCDVMLITHGHDDHLHDAVEIAKQTAPTIITLPEIAWWMEGQGVEGASNRAANKGGTLDVDGIKVTLVRAEHSCGILAGSSVFYGGEPCGFVIEFENQFKIYFAGDTDVFGDMRLIGELARPSVAFLPIGGHFTMDPGRASKAVKLLGVETVVPMHFGTFPILSGRPSQLQALVSESVTVLDIEPGDEV